MPAPTVCTSLTRHTHRKQRGHAGEDTTAGTSPVPGAPVPEDGR